MLIFSPIITTTDPNLFLCWKPLFSRTTASKFEQITVFQEAERMLSIFYHYLTIHVNKQARSPKNSHSTKKVTWRMVTSFVFLLQFYGILGIYATPYARIPEGSISNGAPWHLFTFSTSFSWVITFAFLIGWKEMED